jgi:hypothetical protein
MRKATVTPRIEPRAMTAAVAETVNLKAEAAAPG